MARNSGLQDLQVQIGGMYWMLFFYTKVDSGLLAANVSIILSGCFSGEQDNVAWIIGSHDMGLPQPEPLYYTSAEELCSAVKCDVHIALLYSPDTDVSVIGQQILNSCSKKFIVQINLPSSHDKIYLFLNNLLNAFPNDMDLSSLPS